MPVRECWEKFIKGSPQLLKSLTEKSGKDWDGEGAPPPELIRAIKESQKEAETNLKSIFDQLDKGATPEPPKNAPPEATGGAGEPPIDKKVEVAEGEEGGLSGIKKALVAEKIIEGVDLEKIGDKEMMDLGRKIIETGAVKPEALVTKIITEKTGVLTPTEVVALITYKADVDNGLREAYKQANEKQAAGEDLGTLNVEIKNLERQQNDFDVMAVITANQQSMAFRLRKMMLDKEYNVVTQVEKYKKNNNGYIPPEVQAKFEELGKQLKEVKEKLAEAEKKVEGKEGQEAVDNIKESVDREKKYTEEELQEQLRKERVGSRAAKKEKVHKAIDETMSKWAKKLSADLPPGTEKQGLGDIDKVMKAVGATMKKAYDAGEAIAKIVKDAVDFISEKLGRKDWGIEEFNKENWEERLREKAPKKEKDTPTINEDGTVSIPNKMLRDLVEKGVTDINDLTDAVHKEVAKTLPDITKRQVRDYITEYGKQVNPTADKVQQQVNTAKRVGKLLSELEDLQNKKAKTTNPATKAKITEKERELKRKVRSLEKDLGITDAEKTDTEKLSDSKNRIRDVVDNLQRRLKNKDFAKPTKKVPVTDTELQTLNHKKELLQEEFDKKQYEVELRNRNWWLKIEDAAKEAFTGVSRTLVAGVDFSAGLVQGFYRLFTNPKLSAGAFKEMFKQFASEKRNAEWFTKLKSSGGYEKIKQSGLAVTDEHGRASVKEGLFITNWGNKIYDAVAYLITGGYKPATRFVRQINPIKASQRAWDGYINYIRVAKFTEAAKMAEHDGYFIETDPKIFEKLADHINTTTGRGSLGKLESSASWMSIVMFAPRKVVSEIKLFTPYAFLYYAKMPKYVRQQALLNFATFLGSYVSINAGVWAANQLLSGKGLNDEDDHFWDMTSSDFMTHKFGNTRINIGGGAKSVLVFQARLLTGKFTDQYGKTSDLGNRFGKQINTRWDVALGYLKGKASPGMGAVIKKLDERKGLEVDDADLMKDLIIPMWLQDSKELYKDHPAEIGTLFNILSIFGANVRTVDEQKAPKTFEIKNPETGERPQATQEQAKAKKDLQESLYEKEMKRLQNQWIQLDVYGDVSVTREKDSDDFVEYDGGKSGRIAFSKLDKDQKKLLEQKIKTQMGKRAFKQLFGVEED